MAGGVAAGPLVTVVIPVHNGRSHLDRALDSVVSQSYTNLEIIVSDDGSTDDSAAVARAWMERDGRVRLIQSASASGAPARPRNLAIASSTGSYIALLDHDDVWLPDKIELQVERLQKTGADVCYSRCLIEDADSVQGREDYHQRWTPWLRELPEGDLRAELTIDDVVPCCTAMFRRALAERLGGFAEHLPAIEDYDFWLRSSRKGATFCAVDRPTAVYRWSAGSLSDRNRMQRRALLVDMWRALAAAHPTDRHVRTATRRAERDLAAELLSHATGTGDAGRVRRLGLVWRALLLRPSPVHVKAAGARFVTLRVRGARRRIAETHRVPPRSS